MGRLRDQSGILRSLAMQATGRHSIEAKQRVVTSHSSRHTIDHYGNRDIAKIPF